MEFVGDKLGVKSGYDNSDTMPGRSLFAGKVVVMNNDFEENRFYDMDMTDGLNGTVSVKTKKTDKDLLFIIISAPDSNFENPQTYSYKVNIS